MLVFIHISKTGGNTVSHILRSSYGPRHCQVEPWHARWGAPFSADDLQRVRRLYPNLKSIGGHRVTGYVDLQQNGEPFRYFTFLRNPLQSCASRFQHKVQVSGKKHLIFQEWIQQDWTRNHQTKWIAGVDNVTEAIRIIRDKNIFVCLTEHFDESLVLLKGLVAKDLNISYKRVNVASSTSIKESLLSNELTRQMLTEAMRADLELYEYVRNDLYPAYRREYGQTLQGDLTHFRRTQRNNFNQWNLSVCRLKHYTLYNPLLYLYRKGVKIL